ncbi:MAG: DivIVA domain-containing protein [Gloeocapsa sp. UFS-A4-WI-NPMV-4B04]|jgi:hypothetical protein|nr:DivIVA domain-containing protein [Gloeocapsa sp. UFS-A4-WI-NPMV-4B04]
MLRSESSNIDPNQNKPSTPVEPVPTGSRGIDIQQELNRLEEMVLASPHIPLTRRTLVDEEQLLDQLDLVRVHLPSVFQEAQAIVQQKKEIILQAEQHAERIVQAAQVRAAQILNEMDIIQLAELEAKQIRQQVQHEFEVQKEQNSAEIDQIRFQAQQELEQMRLAALAEADEIQKGADEYADHVLQNIEQQLNDMLRIISNGRQQLQQEPPPNHNFS